MTTTAPAVPTPRKLAGMKRSKKYLALTGTVGLSEQQALTLMLGANVAAALFAVNIEAEPVTEPDHDQRIAELIAAGFSAEEAAQAVALRGGTSDDTEPVSAPEPTPPARAPQPATSKELAETLVGDQGLTFARGRVYLTPDTIEAAVRVRKTGSPEIIRSSGVGRTAAVLLYREDTGDVAAQNLADSRD